MFLSKSAQDGTEQQWEEKRPSLHSEYLHGFKTVANSNLMGHWTLLLAEEDLTSDHLNYPDFNSSGREGHIAAVTLAVAVFL